MSWQLPFPWSIISLQILEKAEKKGVDGHRVDSEEGGGDEVGADDDENDRHEEVVQGGDSVSLRQQKSFYKQNLTFNTGDIRQDCILILTV